MARKRNHKDCFVVASKVREFVRKSSCFAGSDLLEGINRNVAALLARAAERAKNNKRKTVRSYDL
jgi:histone H3/H4